MTAREAVGFLIPVGGLAVASVLRMPLLAAWLAVSVCGAGEGALLGPGQSTALRRSGIRWPAKRWVATAVVASGAWLIGLLPSTLSDLGVTLTSVTRGCRYLWFWPAVRSC